MNKLWSVTAFFAASIVTVAAESAGPDQAMSNGSVAPPEQRPLYNNGPAPGWYPPPPNRGGWYGQPWQQRAVGPMPPRGYGQLPPGYPPPAYQPRAPLPPTAPAENPLSAELKQTQEQLTANRAELDKTQETLTQLQASLQQSREAEQALKDKVAAAAGEQQTLQARVTELTEQLATGNTTLEQTQQQIADAQTQNQALVSEREQLRNDLADRDAQLATLQQELQSATQTLQQAETRTAGSEQQLSAAKTRTEKLQSELTAYEKQLESHKAAQLSAEQALTGEREQLRSELASRDEQLETLKTELQKTNAALALARDGATATGKQLSEVKAHTDSFKTELSELKSQLEEQQTTLLNAEKTMSQVIAERDSLKAELSARDQQLTEAQAGLASARSELEAQRLAESANTDSATVSAPDPAPETRRVEIAALQAAPSDSDGDGVGDSMDLCRETAAGVAVDAIGCTAGMAISLEGVNFRYNSQELTGEAQVILDRVATVLRQNPELRLQVAGHTDTQGDPAYNQWLSLQRAEAVRDYLVEQGVQADYLGAVGYGGQRPIADNSTREGLRMNRRVELQSLR